MRRILLAVFTVFLMLIPVTMSMGETADKKLTVLGDSIASGYGLAEYTPGNNYSAPLSFGNMLGAEFESYRNFAVDGRTSRQLLDALTAPSGTLANAVCDADVIVVSIGGNDFLQPMISAVKKAAMGDYELIAAIFKGEFRAEMLGDYSQRILTSALDAAKLVDVEKTAENIRKCVKIISDANPNARIILMTVYDPFSGNVLLKAASDVAKERLSILNTEIMAMENGNVSVTDVYSAFDGRAGELTNINKLDIHPNAEGHNRIYELLREKIGTAGF
ncbi:MAG: SGNH/GDSL hydrolase family protein [Oscillospiraceae bacterium]|nr:SGNH/GDSL hydrolase family protein [Oscillospiraceae bacterium]